MIHHLFRRDWDTVTYDEVSPLSSGDAAEGLRWTSWEEAQSRILAARSPLVVAKPLVESQNLVQLLDLFVGARAIWMLREVRAVASSNVAFFGSDNAHRDLEPILERNNANWRAEGLAEETRDAIAAVYRRDLSPLDAAALFWYARNSLFFSMSLENDPRVGLCSYEELTAQPTEVMAAAYRFVGRPFPGERITREVQPARRPAETDVVLDPEVESLCEGLWNRFAEVERLQQAPSATPTFSRGRDLSSSR